MLCIVLYTSICNKGHVVIKVKRDCRIAISNRSHDRLKIWRPMDEMEIDTFPRLREDQLRELTFGVYQLWLCTSYKSTWKVTEIHVDVDEPSLL